MWHWLLSAYDRIRIQLRMGLVIALMHGVCMSCLFMHYRNNQYRMHVGLSGQKKAYVTVMQLPEQKMVSLESHIDAKGISVVAEVSQLVQKKAASKNTVTKKAIQKSPVPKKAAPKKIPPKKTAPQKKTPVQQQASKATPIKPKDQHHVPAVKNNEASALHEHASAPQAPMPPPSSAQEIIMIDAISRMMKEQWMPPAGIASDTTCELRMCIDAQGSVATVEVVRSSGMPMFDLMAQAGCKRMSELPDWSCGKEFYITFTS